VAHQDLLEIQESQVTRQEEGDVTLLSVYGCAQVCGDLLGRCSVCVCACVCVCAHACALSHFPPETQQGTLLTMLCWVEQLLAQATRSLQVWQFGREGLKDESKEFQKGTRVLLKLQT
jgi:hypothetical protein